MDLELPRAFVGVVREVVVLVEGDVVLDEVPMYGSPGEHGPPHVPYWEMRALLPQPFAVVQLGTLAGVRLNELSCTDTFLVFQRQSSMYGVVASFVDRRCSWSRHSD